ncbi:hypothetical protein [Kistimonas asteriae]|uniref:hypothetical protein n=1 Tax=Kistimonas asteriae TaxID=517724 RepID=UPI001BACA4B3|nr:hypothetical protein [Kistimonas asteriae]
MTEAAIDNLSALEREAESQEQEAAALEAELLEDKAGDLQAEADEAAARQGAMMAVAMVETLVKMRFDFVTIQPEIRGQIVEKGAAVIRKHGGGLPDWLQPYQEEIELGMVVASAGFGVYMQVQAHKQMEAKKAKQGENDGNAVSATEREHSAP